MHGCVLHKLCILQHTSALMASPEKSSLPMYARLGWMHLCAHQGRSLTWLRRHSCWWEKQTMPIPNFLIYGLMYCAWVLYRQHGAKGNMHSPRPNHPIRMAGIVLNRLPMEPYANPNNMSTMSWHSKWWVRVSGRLWPAKTRSIGSPHAECGDGVKSNSWGSRRSLCGRRRWSLGVTYIQQCQGGGWITEYWVRSKTVHWSSKLVS